MKLLLLLAAANACVAVSPETVIPVDRSGHALILTQVYLNGRGPFRMMIDTGNGSSLIRPAVAEMLSLRPAYAVEQVTITGSRRVPAVLLDEVRIGSVRDRGIEMMIGDAHVAGADGVLGQSWLSGHDYLIDYRHRRIVLDATAPQRGMRAVLRTHEGRPVVLAEVDGSREELVIDSGASDLFLFRRGTRSSGPVELGAKRVSLGSRYLRTLTAFAVGTGEPAPGLLPTEAFGSVYISNRDGVAVFEP